MKKILMLALTATMMLVACKKDKGGDEPETIPTCAMVKWEDSYGYSSTDVVKFDDKGRIKDDGSATYEYFPDKIIVKRDGDNIARCTLDAQGRIVKIEDYNMEGEIDYFCEFEYNNEGYLIKSRRPYGSDYTIKTYTWENGNLVKIVETTNWNVSAPTSVTETITYGNDVIKDKLIAQEIYNYYSSSKWNGGLIEYFGKMSKNAPVLIQSDYPWGSSYTYKKDAKGKINGYKEIYNTGSYSRWQEASVDYNCN
ncbi:hypothetical protein [Pseudopedobacter beijingensis]|uniref:DUF4595 domain-containing protein n=1 Tax=Pseudopedobacter beijingensis TaxID=1207056 RepID=A0ABW4IB66_9SPHI